MSSIPHSETARLEAFSDGVFAIIITIMVLELKIPASADPNALVPLLPIFFSYVLSFIYLAIYWNNHHHLLHATKMISSGIMWSNMHLLFWLSLIPFASGWVGESHGAPFAAAVYGGVLLMAAIAYFILQNVIIWNQGRDSTLALALGNDLKGKISIVLYVLAIAGGFFMEWIAYVLFIAVALMWIIPDRRIDPTLMHDEEYRKNLRK